MSRELEECTTGTGHFNLFLFYWLNLFFSQFLTYISSTLHGLRCMHAKSLQSCPTLCDSMNCSPPGSSVHGILQARILEWVAIPSSRGSSQGSNLHVLCLLHWQVDSLLAPPRISHGIW